MPSVILHVEDDPNDTLFVAMAFRKVAPRTNLVQIADGQAALDYLSAAIAGSRPHLVLLDLKLPRRSGFEILEWMRGNESWKTTPVVILSSSKDPADVERARKLGANSYLVKSVDIPEMRRLVRGVADLAEIEAAASIRDA